MPTTLIEKTRPLDVLKSKLQNCPHILVEGDTLHLWCRSTRRCFPGIDTALGS